MRKQNIVLIHPPIDKASYSITSIYKPRPKIGLESIAHTAKSALPYLSLYILDGEILSPEEMSKAMPTNSLVGISDWVSNHANALFYARKAKESNNTVLLGGPNVAYLSEQILSNNPSVDYLIRGDGEDAFLKILQGRPFQEINNIVYREADNIIQNPLKRTNLRKIPLISFKHTKEWRRYYQNDSEWWTPVSGIRGCIGAVANKQRCDFCSIPYHSMRVQDPELYWQQIASLNSKYGITSFFETGDIFSVGTYPQKLAKHKPSHLNIRLGVDESIRSIDKELYTKSASKLGIEEVFIGI